MLSDKEQKKVFKKDASANPEKYYPVEVLNEKGFIRKKCSCKTYFWTTDSDRLVCGDPGCSGGFQVVDNNPSKNQLTFVEVWKKIIEILEPRGYKPINRYPCVARWNPTTEFTMASIAAFQPYVITGESAPPAKKLIIPQFCLRFGDISNVGITGSHCTGFVMVGQHVFVSPDEWVQSDYFRDIYDFLVEGVGLSKDEFVIHEDAWAGGGSYGPCMEFFSRGVELFNQVYTMFEQTPEGDRELKLKVLDMGLGQERVAWFSQGTPNMYEAIFPRVLEKLREKTQIKLDFELYNRFSRYSAYLNIDEVDDIDEAWENVAKELNMNVKDLKDKIWPMAGIYSIAEHSRALLFAITDGKLPSNVGGGYNLRAIFRRAVSFADQFNWDINLSEVCKWHAKELFDIFPSVSDHLEEVEDVLNAEYRKYDAAKKKARQIVKRIIKKEEITEKILLKLYDENGINPEMVIEAAAKLGKKVVKPDDFYNKVVMLHEQKEQIHQTHKELDVEIVDKIPDTIIDYYDDYLKLKTKAIVQYIKDVQIEGKRYWAVITDKTIAYPTSGGQLHDIGKINNIEFNRVVKQGSYIIHLVVEKPTFGVGDQITIDIDEDWRKQLAAHHTATHVINAAASEVLGQHINQASAKKTYEKAHLDITHYDSLNDEQIKEIENKANEMISENIKLNSFLLPRSDAEQKYGMRLYQGGAVPGKYIRVVEIPGRDVEACGGTHMHSTGEIDGIKIIKSQKIQDGIVRLTFTGGKAVSRLEENNKKILEKISKILNVNIEEIPDRINELLEKRKLVQKSITSMGKIDKNSLILKNHKKSLFNSFEIIEYLAEKLKCTPETIESLIKKNLIDFNRLVEIYKERDQQLKSEDEIEEISDNMGLLIKEFSGLKPKEIISISQKILKENENIILISLGIVENGIKINGLLGNMLLKEKKIHLGKKLKEFVDKFNGGRGGGREDNFQGFIPVGEEKDIEKLKNKIISDLKNFLKK
ncbi:MAG: alanine--tRNA ligase [archaeon]|nr:alanine--tRNA ligase [archaeon]